MISYTAYTYSRQEKIRYGVVGIVLGAIIGMLFFNRIPAVIALGGLGGMVYLKYYSRVLLRRQQETLLLQFKDAMESMISALSAGYSLENSVYEAQKDLMLMYQKEDLIIREFEYLTTQAGLHVPVEKLMLELGERSGIEDIRMFSEILMTAKKTGGNLVKIMKRTADNISEKIETKREIETVIAGKKMEARCMNVIPFGSLVWKSSRDTDYDGVTYGLCRCLLVELQNYRYIGIERGRLDERQRRTYLGSSKKM